MARIDSVESDFYRVPLPMALTDSTHGVMAEASSSPCAFVCRPGASSRSFSGMSPTAPMASLAVFRGYVIVALSRFQVGMNVRGEAL